MLFDVSLSFGYPTFTRNDS